MKIDSTPPAAMLTSNWSRCSSQTTHSFTGGTGALDWEAAEGAEAEAAQVAGAQESAGSPKARAVGAACSAAGTAVRVAPTGSRNVTMSSKRVRESATDI